jgi:hypothetical protein
MVVITTKDAVMVLFWTLTCWKFVALTQTHSGISQLPYTFRCMERNKLPRTLGSATPETLKSGPNRSSMLLINNSNDNNKKGETRIHYHTGMQEFRAEQGQAGDSSNPKHSY